ncbi:unnamed protein product, partial [Meganyctiphanes norvegica]
MSSASAIVCGNGRPRVSGNTRDTKLPTTVLPNITQYGKADPNFANITNGLAIIIVNPKTVHIPMPVQRIEVGKISEEITNSTYKASVMKSFKNATSTNKIHC